MRALAVVSLNSLALQRRPASPDTAARMSATHLKGFPRPPRVRITITLRRAQTNPRHNERAKID